MKATDAEIAVKINALLDLLKWFREHRVKIHLSPTADGWNLKFTVPEEGPPTLPERRRVCAENHRPD